MLWVDPTKVHCHCFNAFSFMPLAPHAVMLLQALIRLYTNNRHKNNVWRPIHSAGILMRVGALQYYRYLQLTGLLAQQSISAVSARSEDGCVPLSSETREFDLNKWKSQHW